MRSEQQEAVGLRLDGVSVGFPAGGAGTLKGLVAGRRQSAEHRWILSDVDLKVDAGERVGIVGHNGAGKTSLLKVAAGIFPPIRGKRRVNGRIAAILLQGLGFDPGLPVHLNIKLALAHQNRLSDYSEDLGREIIEFAELETYADRPLAELSAGMQARLAFATSVFQETDILLMDEIFATGDVRFVDKSIKALQNRIEKSSILLLTGHSEPNIRAVCPRVVVLHHGRVVADGDAASSFATYNSLMAA